MRKMIAIALLCLVPSLCTATITSYVDESGILHIESIEGGEPSQNLFGFSDIYLEVFQIREGDKKDGKVQLLIDISVENNTGKQILMNEPWKNFKAKTGDSTFSILSPGATKPIPFNSSAVDTLIFEIPEREYYGEHFMIEGRPSLL
ncbi:hypothetical protein JXQ70_20770 [bacterium]|nr:hypothetical protein [bacterium]